MFIIDLTYKLSHEPTIFINYSTYTKLNNLKITSLNIDFDVKYFFKYGP